ncbi:gliding motility-associated C-terminal domain-containing protein [Chitinophaga eiseniae]|uniref:Gliding motility-associated C-terminal domain-containing protein n=1 Tax=Chitinophaga eiseniae TaxID=634771 RepID=A0A1T4SY04_9BACT|nr:gliding motility-associated C-terminal domain-containing protein [Chitinophaga eiseniae]SKA32788.1 gliding motility-associated C-terminal domain-containing protein [Chitinophaga eiseniae]
MISKRLYDFLIACLCMFYILQPAGLFAQGENNICFFSTIETVANTAIDFSGTSPTITSYPLPGNGTWWSAAVCKPNGQLRFIVQLRVNVPGYPEPCIFRVNGTPIVGTELRTGALTESCKPVVVPHPGNADQYYIFYSYGKGLLYSLLDMGLNGGAGGIVAGQKDVVLSAYGTIVAKKMTAVKGCRGIWLVVRSRTANQFYSFGIDGAGLHPEPVISEAGTFSAPFHYNYDDFGFLKAAPDGSMLACCGWQGIELFPFEPCSGKITNTLVLETTGNGDPLAPATALNHTRFQDICFSPDNSKLYASQNYWINGLLMPGRLFQYDVDQSGLPAIIASKNLIITNQPSLLQDISGLCILTVQNPLGEIKAGPDRKVYIDNGSQTCLPLALVPAGYNPGPGFHVLHQPDLAGPACLPELNTLVVPAYTGTLGTSFSMGGMGGFSYLQQEVVCASSPPDTLPGQTFQIMSCFKDSVVIAADSNGKCKRWDDASSQRDRLVYGSGTYWVSYYRKDCSYVTDTFRVQFSRVPRLISKGSCPGQRDGMLIAVRSAADTGMLSYTWSSLDGSVLQYRERRGSDTLYAVEPGSYRLRITGASCDTAMMAIVAALPATELTVRPTEATLPYGDNLTLHAEGALLYSWWPSGPLDTPTKADPVTRPLKPTIFSVVGWNQYGCRDTGYVKIAIDYKMPDLLASAFSPNGDGLNDVFKPMGFTYQRLESFAVYNRYGQEVFRTSDAARGWDGTQDGRPCPVGVYYYQVGILYPDGRIKKVKGDITLLR